MPLAPSTELDERAHDLVVSAARAMGAALPELTAALHAELIEAIPELHGDPTVTDLLHSSVGSNIETFVHATQHDIDPAAVRAPAAAVEYARGLAQRGTSSNALLRAYRLGQRRMVDVALSQVGRETDDGPLVLAASKLMHERASTYVDRVSEQVVGDYEAERERWLANRNTVRAATLAAVLEGDEDDLTGIESTLGYRVRQQHLAVVVWDLAQRGSAGAAHDLRRLEQLVAEVGDVLGAVGQALFVPQDDTTAWAWLPLGRGAGSRAIETLERLVADVGPTVRVATGSAEGGLDGFRTSHLSALRAHRVAVVAGERSATVTRFDDVGVEAVSLLVHDLPALRSLVAAALGDLARDHENAARLRSTLLSFLAERGSFLATAERVHLHKNTVKYRVDKAVELRGRPLDEDRFDLELALHACRWLGAAVLTD